jgi:hypothetical protein
MIATVVTAALVVAIIAATRRADRRKEATLAESFARVRAVVDGELTFTDVTAGDVETLDKLGPLPEGIRALGDARFHYGTSDGSPLRVVVDPSETTIGLIGDIKGLFSQFYSFKLDDDGVLSTVSHWTRYPLAVAPFVRFEQVGAQPLDQVVRRHLTRCRGAACLQTMSTLEDAKRQLVRLQLREVAWRNQADIHDLLQADLRAFLGTRYELLGRAITKLVAHVPNAKLVTRGD